MVLQQNAITQTKDQLIKHLRAFLKDPNNYINITNTDYSEAQIFDKEPTQLRKFPSILIVAINGNYINSGIGDISGELYDEFGNCIGFRYSGMFELPITIEVATRTSKERDLLIDLLSLALRVLLRRHLEAAGILIKDMKYGGESEIQYDSNKVYVATLQFVTWSEWYRDVNLLPLSGIDVDIKYQ